MERLRSMAEVSLIFFYAPWCAHSMAARQEVQQVAKKLAKQVQNIWGHNKHPAGLFKYQIPALTDRTTTDKAAENWGLLLCWHACQLTDTH